MASKNKDTIRFAVGTPNDPSSWIWRFWVTGNDIYLGAKDALQAFKVSLHESGIWRIAFVKELKRDDSNDRVIFKWNKPEESPVGWTSSMNVVVSSIKPKRPFLTLKVDDERIIWLSEPGNGKRLVFKIVMSIAKMSGIDLKRILNSDEKILGNLTKKNGEKAWLIFKEDDLSPLEIIKITDVMNKTKLHLRAGSSEDSIRGSRALLVVSGDIPTIIDISLGKENLDIATK